MQTLNKQWSIWSCKSAKAERTRRLAGAWSNSSLTPSIRDRFAETIAGANRRAVAREVLGERVDGMLKREVRARSMDDAGDFNSRIRDR